ncbi:MAG: ion transporter [Flavobacteriales bacterium]
MKLKEFLNNALLEKETESNLGARIINGLVITLILISSAAILLEISFQNTPYVIVFDGIELFTTLFFSLEFGIRIWVANENEIGRPAVLKRLRYIFSFYGLIDFISILPFFLGYFLGVKHLGFLKIIRIIRILRLARYLKSFDFIINATKNKKNELFISMQIVLLFTFVLSVLLFFVENKIQPENFSSVKDALVWSFSKYIGDIAGYGDFTPLTQTGKLLATAVGILSIAIFAVPAGIIASGFVEEIETEKKLKEISRTQFLIERSFSPVYNDIINFSVAPRKRSIPQIQARLTLTETEIFEAVRNSENLRIIWDKSDPKNPNFDLIVVENITKNTDFGYIDNNVTSNIRIVNPLGKGERAISHFCKTLAQIGSYQLVSNELFSGGDFEPETKCRLDINDAFTSKDKLMTLPDAAQHFTSACIHDLKSTDWVIIIRSSASHRDLDLHITFGGDKGNKSIEEVENPTINELDKLTLFHEELIIQMQNLKYKVGTHQDFKSTNLQLLHQFIRTNTQVNVITIFISIDLLSGPDRIYYRVLKHLNLALQTLH